MQRSVKQSLPGNIADGDEKIKRNRTLKGNDKEAIIVSEFLESERVSAARAQGAVPYIIEKLGLALRKKIDRST